MSYQEQTTQNQTVDDDRDETLATHDLLDTAAADGNFTRFLAAVSAAGLESLLRGPDLYTIFIPENDAFQDVEASLGRDLDPGRIPDLVRYHMAPGALTAEELAVSQSLKTLQGESLRFESDGASVRVGGASIVRPDIECTNGVLHAIDRLLVPPDRS